MQPPSSFRQTWTPLVGERATQVMWRSELLSFAYGLAAFGLAVAASFGFARSAALGFALVGGVVTCFALGTRERKKIALALSEYFGASITWRELPVLNSTRFKAACDARGWSPAAPADPKQPPALIA